MTSQDDVETTDREPPRLFVPDDFDVPTALVADDFVLRPLGPEHTEADYEAWTSSIDHIKRTPGFVGRRWPDPALTLEENRRDCAMHARHFAERVGFTYTVLTPGEDDVIGCVYIYPAERAGGAQVRSWVRESHSALDRPLHEAIRRWLAEAWPFTDVDDAAR